MFYAAVKQSILLDNNTQQPTTHSAKLTSSIPKQEHGSSRY